MVAEESGTWTVRRQCSRAAHAEGSAAPQPGHGVGLVERWRRAATSAALWRSRTAGPTQWAAAWTALAQGVPQRGQGLGWSGRPPRKLFRAAAICRAARRVSFRCIAECRMYGLMKGGPEIDVQNCAGLKSTCRTVSTSWRAAPSWAYHPTLPPHQLALAMISVWNAEVADLNARRKSCAPRKS